MPARSEERHMQDAGADAPGELAETGEKALPREQMWEYREAWSCRAS